jgi:hypothetical protein
VAVALRRRSSLAAVVIQRPLIQEMDIQQRRGRVDHLGRERAFTSLFGFRRYG